MEPRTRLLVVLVVAGSLLIAGCTGARTHPALALIGEGDCPQEIFVRLANRDAGNLEVSASGFRVVDASGTVGTLNAAATAAMAPSNFPATLVLANGESAEGGLVFSMGVTNGPYTLRYEDAGATAGVVLNAPAPGSTGCEPPDTSPIVTMSPSQWSGTALVVTITSASSSTLQIGDLSFQIVGPTGTPYFSGAPGGPSGPANVTLKYNDAGGEGRVGADDHIATSVTTAANVQTLHGAALRVLIASRSAGTTTLP